MMRTVVVGAGIMGSGIAVALARAGHQVTVVEPDERVRSDFADRALAMVSHPDRSLPVVASDLDATIEAGLVIEAVPEDLSLKRVVWTQIGERAPESAILATNSSSLDVDDLADCVPSPERVVAMHWFNPAYEIPCVEVAQARQTSASVLERVVSLLRDAGKHPVVVPNRAGFVANRIQFAAIREALLCVEEGISPDAVDDIVRTSFAPRLAALGPLANADLGGLDTYLAIFETLRGAYGERFAPPALLVEHVAHGRLGAKTGSGISDYMPSEAQALRDLRDVRLSRVLNAMTGSEDSAGH